MEREREREREKNDLNDWSLLFSERSILQACLFLEERVASRRYQDGCHSIPVSVPRRPPCPLYHIQNHSSRLFFEWRSTNELLSINTTFSFAYWCYFIRLWWVDSLLKSTSKLTWAAPSSGPSSSPFLLFWLRYCNYRLDNRLSHWHWKSGIRILIHYLNPGLGKHFQILSRVKPKFIIIIVIILSWTGRHSLPHPYINYSHLPCGAFNNQQLLDIVI